MELKSIKLPVDIGRELFFGKLLFRYLTDNH